METTKIALEDEISRTVMAENGCTAHFNYDDTFPRKLGAEDKERRITVMTYNNKKQTTFLLKEVVAKTDEEGLKEVLKYVKCHKEDYDSFSVMWSKKGQLGNIQKSDFYCKDIYEALSKFCFDKEKDEYVVYEVKMNARS